MTQNKRINGLYELAAGQIAVKSFHIAIQLKLDQKLLEKSYEIVELANELQFSVYGLRRLLRILDAYEILSFDGSIIKANMNTPLICYWDSPHIFLNFKAVDNFLEVCKNDSEVFSNTYGSEFYAYLLKNPNELNQFKKWCSDTARVWLPSILEMYDFSSITSLADIGGGEGILLGLILQQYPLIKAILLDQEAMIKESLPILKQFGVHERVTPKVGDFFIPNSLPMAQDLYILCRTLLNWSNEKSTAILNNCSKVMKANSKLIIIDFYIPEKEHPHYKRSLLSDSALYTFIGSSNRTMEEWINLIEGSNLRIDKIYTDSNDFSLQNETIIPLCIIETSKIN